jgi:RHS repeat-associated protein
VRQVIDVNASVEHLYSYGPFGKRLESDSDPDPVTNRLGFTGQYFDEELDQYHLRARQYDPTMMRFMTRDPVRGKGIEPVTLHRYLYCVNDPLNRTDVNGEFSGLAGQLMTHAIKGALWGAVGGTYGGVLKACRTGNGHDIWKGTLAGGIAGGLAGGTAWLGGSGLVGQILGGMMGGAANHTTSAMLNSDYEHFWAELGGAVVVGGALAGIMDYYSVGESVASSGIDAGNARSFLQGVDWLEPAAAELAGGLVTAAEELYDSARENIYDPWE